MQLFPATWAVGVKSDGARIDANGRPGKIV
jgi:hypothetical protein